MAEIKNEETVVVKKTAAKKPAAKKATVAKEDAPAKKAPAKKPAAKKATTKKAVATEEVTETVKKPAAKKAVKIAVKANPKKEYSAYEANYKNVIAPYLMEKFGYSSVMEIPKIEKIVLNMGVGDATSNSKLIDAAFEDMKLIAGQQPVITKAKKSIATFKLREGMPIGVKVTLRGERMYDFLNKLISLALPRVRDFRGVSANAFDGRGNYTLGIKEQLIFPEINYDKVVKVRGLDIVIVTTAKNDEQGRELLKQFGMPFEK